MHPAARRLAAHRWLASRSDPGLCKGAAVDGVRSLCLARAALAAGAIRAHAGFDRDGHGHRQLAELARAPVVHPHLAWGEGDGAAPADDAVERRLQQLLGNQTAAGEGLAVEVRLNSMAAACSPPDGCAFALEAQDEVSHYILGASPLAGSSQAGTVVEVVVAGNVLAEDARVWFGARECNVTATRAVQSPNVTAATSLSVPVCAFEASTVDIFVLVADYGYILGASPYLGADLRFRQTLAIAVPSAAPGSVHGGSYLRLQGFSSASLTGTIHQLISYYLGT